MPDISLCTCYECPFRKNCYRYLAKPSDGYQTYADFKPTDGQCEHFWESTGRVIDTFEVAEERNKKLHDFWHKGGIWKTRKKEQK